MKKTYIPVLRKNFIFITSNSFKSSAERQEDEEYIIRTFFWIENREKFNIIFIHNKEEDKYCLIDEIKEQFVVLFLEGTEKELIKYFSREIFNSKDCIMFCVDNHDLQKEGVINFTKHLGYFVTTEKLSKPYKAYFHEEERPEHIRKLFEV